MNGPRVSGVVVVLALALALSPVAALPVTAPATTDPTTAEPASLQASVSPPVVPDNGTTAYLALPTDDLERTEFAIVGLDVGAMTAADRERYASRYTEHRLVDQYQLAENETAREEAITDGLAMVRDRVAELEARERAALTAFNRGELSPEGYLRELAAVDAGASELASTTRRLYSFTQAVPSSEVTTRDLASVKTRLLTLQGPVRERARRAMHGDGLTGRIYVATSDSGVVLSTIVGEEFERQYIREAYLPEARDTSAPDRYLQNGQHDLEAAENRARELYTWAFDNHGGISTGIRTGQPYLYRDAVYSVAIDHPQGTPSQGDLIIYVDGGTGDVFRELQFKSVADTPFAPAANASTNVSDGLRIQVNRTREGAPVEVVVRDAVSGEPVEAEVFIDGTLVGESGVDGRLYTVTPRSTFSVTARADDRTVSVGPVFPRREFGTLGSG